MKRIFRELVSRFAMGGLFIVLGGCVCWRALSNSETSMLAPVMLVILAMVLGMTGIALVMRASDLEEPSEQTPARQN